MVGVVDGSAYCVQWWALVSYGAESGVGTRQVIFFSRRHNQLWVCIHSPLAGF